MLIDHMLFVQNSTREVFDIIEVFDKTTAGLAVFVDILVAMGHYACAPYFQESLDMMVRAASNGWLPGTSVRNVHG